MKLVKGTILSSKPISLSKASSILTRFLSTETGAPPAISIYLKRAAEYEILKGNDSGLIRGEKKRKLETEDAFEQTNHHKKKKRKNKNEN